MLSGLFRSFRLVKKKTNLNYLKEHNQWKKDFEANRAQHLKDYWEIQTEVENDFITSLNDHMLKKFHRRATKNRDAVIRISNRTVELNQEREEKRTQKASMKKAHDEEYARTLLRKQELMQIMNIESKKWITLENYKERITESLIIPENLDHSSYYAQLRDSALIAGLGKIVPEGSDYNNKEETTFKNRLIVPIFANVRSAIRKLSYSPLQPLFEDFEATKSLMYSYPDKLEEIKKVYQGIAAAWKDKERKDPKVYLKRIFEQVRLLNSLVFEWNQYISVTKYDDQEVHLAFSHLIHDEYKCGFQSSDSEDEPLSKADGKQDFEEANPETSDALDMALNPENKEDDDFLKLKQEEISSSATSSTSDLLSSESDKPEAEETEIRFDANEVVKKVNQNSDIFSDFDMYKGVSKEAGKEDLKFVERVVNEAIKDGRKEPEQELNYEEDKEKVLGVEEFVCSPTYAVLVTKKRVEEIGVEELDEEGREMRYLVLQSLDQLMGIKVEEAHMLVKVYKYHRYDPPVFE